MTPLDFFNSRLRLLTLVLQSPDAQMPFFFLPILSRAVQAAVIRYILGLLDLLAQGTRISVIAEGGDGKMNKAMQMIQISQMICEMKNWACL